MVQHFGALQWQLNDCWPVTSWSSVDYYGRWKALHYAVKSAFQKYIISVDDTGKIVQVHITSDDTAFTKATLILTAEDFAGNILWGDSTVASLSPGRSIIAYKENFDELTVSFNPLRTFLKMELKKNGNTLAQKIYYFKKPKDLLIDKPDVHFTVQKQNDGYVLSLSAKTLAKNILIEMKDSDAHFSENYFDLLPKETKTVSFKSTLTIEEIQKKIIVKSLTDTF